jgi:membrane protease YdiL (CAAX protease family)
MKAQLFFQKLPWLVIGALLLLRFLSGWLPYLAAGTISWLTPLFQVGTYGLAALFFWLKRDRLGSYHVDRLVIGIFLLFKCLYPLLLPIWLEGASPSALAFPNPLGFSFWGIAILFWLAIRADYFRLPQLRRTNWGWLAFGIVFGILWGFVVVYLLPVWISGPDALLGLGAPLVLAVRLPIQLGSAAINEEPLFRGILWGQLRQAGWKETWIWLFQAGLFTFSHGGLFMGSDVIPWLIFYLAGGLAFGLIVWRARSIAPSMLAHAVFNTSSVLIGILSVSH